MSATDALSRSPLMRAQLLLRGSSFSIQTRVQEKNMKTLRKLASILVLALMLSLPAFAGQLDTPPCAQPAPGQLDTPPCQGSAPSDMATPSSTETAANMTYTEIATEVLENLLSIS
jgi:hypothetical protein